MIERVRSAQSRFGSTTIAWPGQVLAPVWLITLTLLDPFFGYRAGHGQDVVLLVDGAELALKFADFGFVAQPIPQRIQDVREAQVAHPERALLVAAGAARFVIHVYIDELVVDRGVAVPTHEVGLARPRGNLVADLYVIEVKIDCHDHFTRSG
jgi:hypothetical protein